MFDIVGVHLPGPGVLPEAEAHGAGQDARPQHGAPRRPHQAAHRGQEQGRGAEARGDGERLPHRSVDTVPSFTPAVIVR